MRWDNAVRFAFTPTACECGHTVWLEKYYYVGDKDLGVCYKEQYKCKECYKKKK